MIVEVARIRAREGAADALEAGLCRARGVISRAEGYRGSAFHRGIEDPGEFILTIWWDSVDHHMKGFREGPLFPDWRAAFAEHMAPPPVVAHYTTFVGEAP